MKVFCVSGNVTEKRQWDTRAYLICRSLHTAGNVFCHHNNTFGVFFASACRGHHKAPKKE